MRLRRPLAVVAGVAAAAILTAGMLSLTGWLSDVEVGFPAPGLPHPRGPVLPLPAPGEVLPALLADGWPVFVVRHEDGSTDVVSAVNPHRGAAGLDKALAWCPSSRWFEDPHHGSTFSEWGAWMGGPAPTGLVHYRWRPDQDGLVVGGPEGALPRGQGQRAEPTGASCETGQQRRGVVGHRRGDRQLPTPGALLAEPADGWRAAEAALVVDPRVVQLCGPQELVGDRCPGSALRLAVPGAPLALATRVLRGPILLWISEGEVRAPILLVETAAGT